MVKEYKEEIDDLKNTIKIKIEISNNLNKQIKDLKSRAEKEKVLAKKMYKAEVQSWKKELGEERKKNINLEKKLEKVVSKNKNDEKVVEKMKIKGTIK